MSTTIGTAPDCARATDAAPADIVLKNSSRVDVPSNIVFTRHVARLPSTLPVAAPEPHLPTGVILH
jgi:hypothetical protein